MDQTQTPLFDAVKKYVDAEVVRFHVPGHKQGQGIPELLEYMGFRAVSMDVNGMRELDYINNPSGVIRDAQFLMAQAFGADRSYLLVNGTTSGVQTMIMSACEPGTEIILPRNAHKSTIGGVILSGAIPVYLQPEFNKQLGIAMGVSVENLKKTIQQHPHAKAVFVINPTYYGYTSHLQQIVDLAHQHNMAVLVDEAHGAHMGFHPDFPITAMEAGADMSAASIHKTAGSLTQSSVLLANGSKIAPERIAAVLNMTYTSSASYLLMCSLDVARKQLALQGRELLAETLAVARWARAEINAIEGVYCFGRDLIGSPGSFGFDETKLGINVRQLGCTGYQLESRLRDEYNIQMELSDLFNTLAILSLHENRHDVERLIQALQEIVSQYDLVEVANPHTIPICPEMIVTPRDAFYSHKKLLALDDCVGEIAGEMIMAYPPGIPVICMGERITLDIIDYIKLLKNEKCELQGAADPQLNFLRVLGGRN
ncbi:MAG: aminotransferase class I/II-fold pyridoxal phosphate-dependent enzyme [Methylocystaceae bacterium]